MKIREISSRIDSFPANAIHNNKYNKKQYQDFYCRVCKQNLPAYTNNADSYHAIVVGDIAYLVPTFHQACRELFNLNPLAYEKL